MKNVSRLLPLLPGIALLTGCNQKVQKDNGQNSQKPNIIYIFADDLGIGDLSCYGATKVSTPHIDRLAGQGVQFTNAYATSATSTPSRFGLLTGMYPWRQENTGIAPGNSELIIDTACVTMADMLKEAGYATGVVGKWHLGLGPKGGTDFNGHITPNAQSIGFDYEFVIPATVDRVPCVFVENGHVVGLDPNDPITVNYEHKVGDWPTGEENPELVKLKPSQGHNNTIINGIPRIGWMTGGKSALWKDEDIADIITNKAKSFIVSHKEEPFFLYMGTQDVHVPRVPHPRFAGKSGLGTRGDVILQLDWTIGEIMNTLDSLQLTDNTILIFTSDNGPVIDDIINLPHPTSKRHPRMPIRDRAAIFSPFAALSGHGAAIAETARLTEQKIELDEDTKAELDRRQAVLLEYMDERPELTVTWFQRDEKKDGGAYLTTTGRLKKLRELERSLVLTDGTEIPLEDVVTLESDIFQTLM